MIYTDYNLKRLNSFALNCRAKTLVEIKSEADLLQLPNLLDKKNIILGKGCNTIFANEYFDGLVVYLQNKGISIIEENTDYVVIEAFAGEDWDDLIEFCCNNNFWGIENLAAIPSSVGAAIVQNIGAYGSEIKDSFLSCLTYNPIENTWKEYNNEECAFGYRYSIFKYPKRFEIIWKIRLRLSLKPNPNTSYYAIKEKIEKEKINISSPSQMKEIVTQIRNSKLPDTKLLPNCGSFFKNPVVSEEDFLKLEKLYPNIPYYPAPNGVKLAAGWLIEQTGWKGKRVGNVGMHSKQALCMVSYGDATAKEILYLAQEITNSIKEKFNIELEKEVHIVL